MPGYDDDPFDPYYDRPFGPYLAPDHRGPHADLDRLTHLVLVDGRLVDVWSEPAHGTRWEDVARRFDAERRPAPAPVPPPPPPWERALAWLAGVCGSAEAVDALTSDPLTEDGLDLPAVAPRAARERLEQVAELLDRVAERWFDVETSFALRRALLLTWADDPQLVLDARSAEQVAGGIAWAVAKANGLLRPQGELGVKMLQESLDLGSSPSATGNRVRLALWGLRSLPGRPLGEYYRYRPDGMVDLLELGQPGVLLGRTRVQLLRVRRRAWEARDAASAASATDVLP